MWSFLRFAIDRMNLRMSDWDELPKEQLPTNFHFHTAFFEHGLMHLPAIEEMTPQHQLTACRFANAFGFAYQRFRELGAVEAQAREAERRSAVDHIRAEIAAMHTSDDLPRITSLLWQALNRLGVPFYRCGVFVVDDESERLAMYMSDAQGDPVASVDLSWEVHPVMVAIIDHWRRGEPYFGTLSRADYTGLVEAVQSGIQDLQGERYIDLGSIPEQVIMHVLPFIQGTLYVGNAERLSPDDVAFVNDLAAAFSVAYARYLDFKRLEADNVRKTQELEKARRLQLSLLPESVPRSSHFDIAWIMRTATQVGGDYYDYSIANDGTLTLCVGDATGHGMDSGVVVTGTKTLFRTFADAPSITNSLSVMSTSLKGMNLPRMGMAMTILRLRNTTCTVSSAGMPPVMIYRVAKAEVEETVVTGFPLGVSDTAQYQEESFDVAEGDVIIIMTDGLPERLNSEEKQFDYHRTKRLFAEASSESPQQICDALLRGAEEWAGDLPQDDDITLVVLKAR